MATRNENSAPFMAVHPGMMIKPELDERGISQKAFAKMLGTQPSHLSEVLNGKRALTTDLAMKIEHAIGLPAKLLLSAQTQYELELASQNHVDDKQQETVTVTIPIKDHTLLQELVRRFGWACVF
jgi:HTH-type transcriptional regulator/antitoxin HigA